MSLNVSNENRSCNINYNTNTTLPYNFKETDYRTFSDNEVHEIYSSGISNTQNTDAVTHRSYGIEFFREQETKTEAETEPKQNVKELKEEYEEIKKEQGFVGKSWNWIKNKLPFLSRIGCNGSDKIEEIIAQAERGEISTEEAQEAIEKYKKNQEIGTEIALDVGTGIIVGGVLLLSGPLGWTTGAILGIGAAVGAAARIGLGAADAATNDIKGDYSFRDALIDGVKGAIIGAAKGIGKLIGCFIPKPAEKIKESSEIIVDNMEDSKPLFLYCSLPTFIARTE